MAALTIVNQQLAEGVDEVATLTQPDDIYRCDDSDNEWERITTE